MKKKLLYLGSLALMIVSYFVDSEKEKIDREAMKSEIKEEVLAELTAKEEES